MLPQGQRNSVIVVSEQDGKYIAEKRQIEIGGRRYGEVEVLSNLSAGEKVVTHGAFKVKRGAEVTISEDKIASPALAPQALPPQTLTPQTN